MQLKTLTVSFQSDYNDIPKHWLEDWLLHVIKKPMSFLITDSDYQLSDSELKEWNSGIEKMRSGTPLAYLIGKQEFWSLDFIVNEHTLIPRADTEVLVEKVLEWINYPHPNPPPNPPKGEGTSFINSPIKEETPLPLGGAGGGSLPNLTTPQRGRTLLPHKLLDLGTGTGCIAISLAYELSKAEHRLGKWQVTAVDFSEQALKVAKQNARLNQVDNIHFIQSSWFDNLDQNDKDDKYAVIVSNPPYIDKTDEHLPQLTAEPITALVADNHGLADIEQIISGATDHLQQGGLLAIEHGYNQGDDVQQLFRQTNFTEIKTIKDYCGNDRVTMGVFLAP